MLDIKESRRVIPEMVGILDDMSNDDLKKISAWYSSQKHAISGTQKRADSNYDLDAKKFLAMGRNLRLDN